MRGDEQEHTCNEVTPKRLQKIRDLNSGQFYHTHIHEPATPKNVAPRVLSSVIPGAVSRREVMMRRKVKEGEGGLIISNIRIRKHRETSLVDTPHHDAWSDSHISDN